MTCKREFFNSGLKVFDAIEKGLTFFNTCKECKENCNKKYN